MKKIISIVLIAATFALSGCASQQPIQDTQTQETQAINTVHIQDKTYETTYKEETSVYDLMINLESEQGLTFDGQDYGDMGFLIEEINGIENSTDQDKYWIYYVNDQKSTMGISQYILQPNDSITWRYEPYI